MALNTYSGLTNAQRLVYEGTLIKRLLPHLVLFEDGQKGTVPRHAGGFQLNSIQWRKYSFTTATALATTALTEGTPPTEDDLQIITVATALVQYGSWSRHSDVFRDAGIDDGVAELVGLHGEQAGQSLHSLITTELGSGSSIRYANGRASRITVVAGDNLTGIEIKKAVRDLETNKAPRFPDGYYRGVVHTKPGYDLMADTAAGGWIDINKYSNVRQLLAGEIGTYHGVRFRQSTEAPVFVGAGGGAPAIDVFATFIYGPGAWGVRDFAGQTVGRVDPNTNRGVNVHIIPVEADDKSDPLHQYGTVGWKVAFTVKVLDSARILRVESAASA